MKAKYSFFGFHKKDKKELSEEKQLDKQRKLGFRVEKEHHKSDKETKQIVEDHLREDPRYYTKLLKAGL